MNMDPQSAESQESERQRQLILSEMIAEHGANWPESYGPGSFGCHELLDRTLLMAEAVEQQVLSHPTCAQNPQWYALAERAVIALQELYQRIGAEHMTEKRDAGT